MERPFIRYYGGKFRIAAWVISLLPEHSCYVEPFGGGAAVLLQKPRSYAEVYNDIDGQIVNLFRVCQDDVLRQQLIEKLKFTPYSRDEFKVAQEICDDPVESARRTLILSHMGHGSSGLKKRCTGFRGDVSRPIDIRSLTSRWGKYPVQLEQVAERLQGVLIENVSWERIIEKQDGIDTLFNCDPPYEFNQRTSKENVYNHEFSSADHEKLAATLLKVKGMVVLSGYPGGIYDDLGWKAFDCKARTLRNAERTERIWMNEQAHEAKFRQPELFVL